MSLGNLSQNYFSRLLDPKYRQAQQQQNLFSNLLQYGAQMRAAGAPTTNVGQPALLASKALGTLGQNLMKGNQTYQNQLMDAIKLKSMMDTSKRAQSMHDIDLKLKQQDLARQENWQKFLETLQPGAATTPQTSGMIVKDEEGDKIDSISGMGVSGEIKKPVVKTGMQLPPGFMSWKMDKQQEWLGEHHSKQLDPNKDYTQSPDGPQLTESGKVKIENQFRKEFLAGSKDYIQVRNSYARILAAIKDPTPAGDIALVFSYMKVLDPNSAVRETEYATAENAGNIPQRIRATWNKVFEGKGRLSVAQRQDFTQRATGLYNAQRDQYRNFREIYVNMAKGKGVGSEFAAPDIETPFPVIAIPKIGDIRVGAKGKRYKLIGDDPSLQSNWKLVE